MYNLKEELLEKLRNGEILVKNVDYPCEDSLLMQEILDKALKRDSYVNGNSAYYTIRVDTNSWTANIHPSVSSLPVVDSTDFIHPEKVENYEIY